MQYFQPREVSATRVEDASHIGEVRRRARNLALLAGFDETRIAHAAILATEISTNVLKHGGGGQIWVQAWCDHEGPAVEIVAVDRGPGMSDIDACMQDGFSTAATSGNGLGAVKRLATFWDIYSAAGRGVALVARIGAEGAEHLHSEARTAGVQSPKPGETVCGDAWTAIDTGDRVVVVVADGLGHGPDAARASQAAMESAHKYMDARPKEMVEAMNSALRPTRGAAVAVADCDRRRRIVTFAGLGNVSGCVCRSDAPVRHLVSSNGTAGMQPRNIREFQSPWPEGAVVILHSDGIGTHWDLNLYPGLLTRDPAVISGVLFRDHCRGADDATAVASR